MHVVNYFAKNFGSLETLFSIFIQKIFARCARNDSMIKEEDRIGNGCDYEKYFALRALLLRRYMKVFKNSTISLSIYHRVFLILSYT